MNKLDYLKTLILLLLLTLPFSACHRDEFAIPGEFRDFTVNMDPAKAPAGYKSWNWGISSDSISFRISGQNQSFAEFEARHPEWITRSKFGTVRFSLNLLPDQYSIEYGIMFDTVNLLFGKSSGFRAVERVLTNCGASSADPAVSNTCEALLDSLTRDLGEPHNLQAKQMSKSIHRTLGKLWKSADVIVELSQYKYSSGQQRLFLITRYTGPGGDR